MEIIYFLVFVGGRLDLHKDVKKDYARKFEQYKVSIITPQRLDEEVPTPVAGFG